MTDRTLVTGARGFIGHALVRALARQGLPGIRAFRSPPNDQPPESWRDVNIGSINANTGWAPALKGVSTVVHLAARVHVMRETVPNPKARFTEVNVDGTARLARDAAEAGVKRLVFLSSIKVLGETTDRRDPFTEKDELNPHGDYATSKAEAEESLRQIAKSQGMEYVIVRAPLVYGPNVKGNFPVIMDWIERRVPLPLGWVNNQRTFLGLDNLVDFLSACLQHPAAANKIFHAGDNEDISTTELLHRIADALETPPRLVPIPGLLLRGLAAVSGQGALSQRLLSSLQVDTGKARRVLGWEAKVSMEDQLARMVKR